MNIAIVDDEKISLETAEIFLRCYIKKFRAEIHIETFYSARDFLTFFSPKIYRLVILGGHMKNIAELIRAYDVKILFLNDDSEEDL